MPVPSFPPAGSAGDALVNGIRLHVRVDGSSTAPWLLLANPLGANLSVWDDVVSAYAGRYRTLRYDQRGHGRSEVAAEITIDRLVDDAGALLDACDIPQARLMGVSMGATTVLGLAARHPERVSRVVACDGQWASAPGAAAMWEQRIAEAQAKGMGAVADATIARWFTAPTREAHPAFLDTIHQMVRTTRIDGYAGCARALSHFDLRAAIGGIGVPTLLVVGAADGTLPAVMREMHARIAGSRFVEIAGAGHLPHVEQPDAFHRAVDPFLAE